MLKTLMMSLAVAALALPALADCAGDDAALRALAKDAADLAPKIEAHRALVSTAASGLKNAATDDEKTTFDEQLSTYETELDDMKAARKSALYDIFDLRPKYEKSCKTPAQPLLDEFGITAADLALD